MNDTGLPDTTARLTLFQSSPEVLSMMAQPSSVGSPGGAEHQAVARFPYRGRRHVAGDQLARAGAHGVDVDAAAVAGVGLIQHRQIVRELALLFWIAQFDGSWRRPSRSCGCHPSP